MHHNHYQYERKLCKNNVKKINYKISCHLYNIKNLKTGTKIQKIEHTPMLSHNPICGGRILS